MPPVWQTLKGYTGSVDVWGIGRFQRAVVSSVFISEGQVSHTSGARWVEKSYASAFSSWAALFRISKESATDKGIGTYAVGAARAGAGTWVQVRRS